MKGAKNFSKLLKHEWTAKANNGVRVSIIIYLLISAIKGVAYILELTSVCHLSSKFLGHCVFNKASSSLITCHSEKQTNQMKRQI